MKKQFIKASILTALTLTAAFSFPTAAHAAWDYTGGHWFYTTNDGVATGWKDIGGVWYYFSEIQNQHTFKGEMATGWKNINGKWYYFYNNGSMATNTTINGFRIDPSGVWIPDNNAITTITSSDTAINNVTNVNNNITTNNNNNSSSVNTSTENTHSSNQTSANTKKEKKKKQDVKNDKDLAKYLAENYSALDTPIGTLKFTFSVYENSDSWDGCDYTIDVKYGNIENSEYGLVIFSPSSLESSIKITDKDKEETLRLLKSHQKKIAKAAMDIFPEKKIEGSYYHGWYKYSYIKVDWQTRRFFSWKNYETINDDYDWKNKYYNTEVTDFHWTPEEDDYFN